MAKKNDNKKNVVAQMTFTADKMLPKMKKCLVKQEKRTFCMYPAIEMETGMMVASDGHTLAAHKLKDYTFTPSEGACLDAMVMLPVEVLQMKGRVEVTVAIDEYETVVTAKDEQGSEAELRETARYPRWRTVIPRTTGWPIDVDSKAWDAALKDILPKMKDCSMSLVRLYGEQKSKTLSINWDNYDEQGSKEVNVGEMPFKMWFSVDGKRLRNVMAFQPTAMRFSDCSRAVVFHSDDTLCLLMPMIGDDYEACGVEQRYQDRFDLERWIGADLGEVVVDNTKDLKPITKREPTLEDRLRAALRKQFAMAA